MPLLWKEQSHTQSTWCPFLLQMDRRVAVSQMVPRGAVLLHLHNRTLSIRSCRLLGVEVGKLNL